MDRKGWLTGRISHTCKVASENALKTRGTYDSRAGHGKCDDLRCICRCHQRMEPRK